VIPGESRNLRRSGFNTAPAANRNLKQDCSSKWFRAWIKPRAYLEVSRARCLRNTIHDSKVDKAQTTESMDYNAERMAPGMQKYHFFVFFIPLLVFLSPFTFRFFSSPPSIETSSSFRFFLSPELLTLTTVEVPFPALAIRSSATVQSVESVLIAYLQCNQ